MNVVLYFICLVLILPIAGFAAFGFLIDSIVAVGLWEVAKTLLAPLYDPFGKGTWLVLLCISTIGLCGAGFFPQARPFGFGAIALGGIICSLYVVKSYQGPFLLGPILLFIPSTLGIGISVYSLVRPIR